MCESDVADDIVKSFISDSETQTTNRVLREIEALLCLNLSEHSLRDFLLKEIGCSYCYWHDWPNGEEWLKHVSFKLQQAQ